MELPNNLGKYLGEWIVLSENEVIAHNKNLNAIKDIINNCKKTPTILRIPEEKTLLF